MHYIGSYLINVLIFFNIISKIYNTAIPNILKNTLQENTKQIYEKSNLVNDKHNHVKRDTDNLTSEESSLKDESNNQKVNYNPETLFEVCYQENFFSCGLVFSDNCIRIRRYRVLKENELNNCFKANLAIEVILKINNEEVKSSAYMEKDNSILQINQKETTFCPRIKRFNYI
jgi:hypothetical protein